MSHLKIVKFQVENFRNLFPNIVEFGEGLNCIVGENSNGKTNLLEAIYVLTQGGSFRKNTSFAQFLCMDGDKSEIYFSSVIKDINKNYLFHMSAKYDGNERTYLIDGKKVRRDTFFSPLVIGPFDSYSFFYNTKFRRGWFDRHIGHLNNDYRKKLTRFTQLLQFRNKILSFGNSKDRGQLLAIDKEISSVIPIILLHRVDFIKGIKDSCREVFKQIFSTDIFLEIKLKTNFEHFSKECVFDHMQKQLGKDFVAKRTTYCIHMDDYAILLNGLDSQDFASVGQQKIGHISLELAYTELFRCKFNSYPLILADDVSSELDGKRWQRLTGYLKEKKIQVFLTTVNDHLVKNTLMTKSAIVHKIIGGKITPAI